MADIYTKVKEQNTTFTINMTGYDSNNNMTGVFVDKNRLDASNYPITIGSESQIQTVVNPTVSYSSQEYKTYDVSTLQNYTHNDVTDNSVSMTQGVNDVTYEATTPDVEATYDNRNIVYDVDGYRSHCKVYYYDMTSVAPTPTYNVVKYSYCLPGDNIHKDYNDVFNPQPQIRTCGWSIGTLTDQGIQNSGTLDVGQNLPRVINTEDTYVLDIPENKYNPEIHLLPFEGKVKLNLYISGTNTNSNTVELTINHEGERYYSHDVQSNLPMINYSTYPTCAYTTYFYYGDLVRVKFTATGSEEYVLGWYNNGDGFTGQYSPQSEWYHVAEHPVAPCHPDIEPAIEDPWVSYSDDFTIDPATLPQNAMELHYTIFIGKPFAIDFYDGINRETGENTRIGSECTRIITTDIRKTDRKMPALVSSDISARQDYVSKYVFADEYETKKANDYIDELNRQGYTFIGWVDDQDNLVVNDTFYNSQTLFGKWEINSYNVTISNDDPDHIDITGSSASGTYQYGTTLTLRQSLDNEYEFGDYYEMEDNVKTNTTLSDSKSLGNDDGYIDKSTNMLSLGDAIYGDFSGYDFGRVIDDMPYKDQTGNDAIGQFTVLTTPEYVERCIAYFAANPEEAADAIYCRPATVTKYTLDGWSINGEVVQEVETTITVTEDMVITANMVLEEPLNRVFNMEIANNGEPIREFHAVEITDSLSGKTVLTTTVRNLVDWGLSISVRGNATIGAYVENGGGASVIPLDDGEYTNPDGLFIGTFINPQIIGDITGGNPIYGNTMINKTYEDREAENGNTYFFRLP